MSEKIGLARAEIVDLLALILRTHSHYELFSLFRSAEGITPKVDPDAWRAENTRRQLAGEKFDYDYGGDVGWKQTWCNFNYTSDTKERFRLHDENAWREENLKKQAAGVKFEGWTSLVPGNWKAGTFDFSGNKQDYREVPQEYPVSPKVAAMGVEPQPVIPHAAERALWKAQRAAGTNDVWQKRPKIVGIDWADIRHDLMFEPGWDPEFEYRVKPTKLTAKICRAGKLYPISFSGQDWEFFGTREEYRAECDKYGYVVVSNIEEVKPKTVKYYFALVKSDTTGVVITCSRRTKAALTEFVEKIGHTIIGDIEEREIEA